MKRQVQFSKRIVTGVTAAVTLICIAATLLCWSGGDFDNLIRAVTAYISYATIVFAAYSGNSAVEKWLIRKYNDTNNDTNDKSDNG